MLKRQEVIEQLIDFLEPMSAVNAVWEGGSTAFNRNDGWSDIDLMLDVADADAENVMKQVTAMLETKYGIDLKYDINPPHWPDMVQTFFRLKNSSPFMLIDFAILKTSAKSKFLERQIHGTPLIYFDKKNVVQPIEVNEEELRQKLLQRIPLIESRFEIFQVMIEKELQRRNFIDAFAFYLGFTLHPLVEALRIQYAPHQYNFGARYLHQTLPESEAALIQSLYFVANPEQLAGKWKIAKDQFYLAINAAKEKLKAGSYA